MLTRPAIPLLAAASLLLAACGSMPPLVPSATDTRSPDAEGVEMGKSEPAGEYQRIGRFYGFVSGECESPRAAELRAATLASLRGHAGRQGADFVHVIGTGPIKNRPQCGNDEYRVSGVGYRLDVSAMEEGEADVDTPGRQRGRSEPRTGETVFTDQRGTAEKLRELGTLREQDLVSESEYQRLRERILDEAF